MFLEILFFGGKVGVLFLGDLSGIFFVDGGRGGGIFLFGIGGRDNLGGIGGIGGVVGGGGGGRGGNLFMFGL